MNIHEYQAKEILKNFNVKIQEGYVANSPDEAYQNAKKLSDEKDTNIFVIKAQIHAGGRGKGKIKETGSNGVVIAKNIDDVKNISSDIIGGTLVTHQTGEEGKTVNKILIAEDVYYPGDNDPKEFYLGILLDRTNGKNVIQTEKDLKRIFPKKIWSKLHLQIIFYGREYCKARECYGLTCKICSTCYPNRKKPVITKKA